MSTKAVEPPTLEDPASTSQLSTSVLPTDNLNNSSLTSKTVTYSISAVEFDDDSMEVSVPPEEAEALLASPAGDTSPKPHTSDSWSAEVDQALPLEPTPTKPSTTRDLSARNAPPIPPSYAAAVSGKKQQHKPNLHHSLRIFAGRDDLTTFPEVVWHRLDHILQDKAMQDAIENKIPPEACAGYNTWSDGHGVIVCTNAQSQTYWSNLVSSASVTHQDTNYTFRAWKRGEAPVKRLHVWLSFNQRCNDPQRFLQVTLALNPSLQKEGICRAVGSKEAERGRHFWFDVDSAFLKSLASLNDTTHFVRGTVSWQVAHYQPGDPPRKNMTSESKASSDISNAISPKSPTTTPKPSPNPPTLPSDNKQTPILAAKTQSKGNSDMPPPPAPFQRNKAKNKKKRKRRDQSKSSTISSSSNS